MTDAHDINVLRDRVDERSDKLRAEFFAALEAFRTWSETRNAHRAAAIAQVGRETAEALADLARGSSKPGWVWTWIENHEKWASEEIKSIREDHTHLENDIRTALGEDGWVKKQFKQQSSALTLNNRLLLGALVALIGNLAVIVLGGKVL